MGIFNGSIFLYDLDRSLLTDSRHPRYIVRSISHQSFYVYKLFWSNPVYFLYIRGIVVFHFRPSLLRFRNPDLYLFCRQLEHIPVPGNDGYIQPFFLTQA